MIIKTEAVPKRGQPLLLMPQHKTHHIYYIRQPHLRHQMDNSSLPNVLPYRRECSSLFLYSSHQTYLGQAKILSEGK